MDSQRLIILNYLKIIQMDHIRIYYMVIIIELREKNEK